MFIALTANNQHITAEQAEKEKNKTNKNQYLCPACQEAVFLKNGLQNQAHFAHYAHSSCAVFSEGETSEHLSGKKLLYEWFKKQNIPCQMEAYLPKLQQRPDLLIWLEPDWPVAIEFQCSSLSSEKMRERTEGYLQNGYDIFWITGKKFQLKKRITSFQRLFLNQHPVLGLYFLFLDSEKRQLEICYQVSRPQPGGYCTFDTHQINLEQQTVPLREIVELIADKEEKIQKPFSYLKSHDYLVRGRLYQSPKMVEFQKYIYYRGDSLISLAKEVYFPVQNEWLIQTIPHFWKYKILEWINLIGVGGFFSKREFEAKIKEMERQKEILFYFTPILSEKMKKGILYHYLALLTEQHLITPISANEWTVLHLPHSYSNEREKIADFEQSDKKTPKKIF